ncbi:unnamed protein product [Phytophthora fragariaefolia]|uniref:Unnamed protein product n=1 Tax=Phytophthora fragariaefolia TaxID=1490495 RepID=A0A9W6XF48_9STRA|nr:unnamed protein product [Phytophthora fragariaefolia]
MPSKSIGHPKKCYVRLNILQKAMLCEMARVQASMRDVRALQEWATRAFDLPQLPSKSTIHEILKSEAKYRNLPEEYNGRMKFGSPEFEEIDRALVGEFDVMSAQVPTLTDYGLRYRSKLFVDTNFESVPNEKKPGFSKGWAYRFRKRNKEKRHL